MLMCANTNNADPLLLQFNSLLIGYCASFKYFAHRSTLMFKTEACANCREAIYVVLLVTPSSRCRFRDHLSPKTVRHLVATLDKHLLLNGDDNLGAVRFE